MHYDVLREGDEVLQLVHERAGNAEADVVGAVGAARRAVRIGHNGVEDLTIVGVRIARAAAEVFLIEKAGDLALRLALRRGGERIDGLRHEHDDMSVLIDICWWAKGEGVDRVQSMIEQCSERLQL